MARKYIECRKLLNNDGCTLAISGAEDEVLDLAVLHAVVSHGCDDPFEVREQFRLLLSEVPESKSAAV